VTAHAPTHLVAPEAAGAGTLRLLPPALVVAAVVFNAVLAIVNAHVRPLSPAHVIAAEVAIVAAAHVIALANYKPQMTVWYALSGILVLFALYRSFAFGAIEAKYLRDVLLIPTFVVLGMTFDQRGLTRLVVLVHALVLAFLLLEALNTDAYSALFRVQDYYINTREYGIDRFWNKESDLYVSTMRPDSRLFSFLDLHRLSSVFLEPVSLGNYCILVVAFVCARYRRLGLGTRCFLLIGTVVALIGCDGRLAAGASLMIIVTCMLAPLLPRHSAALYLPAVTLATFVIVNMAGFHAGADNWSGRIAHTVELLNQYDLAEFIGISNDYLSQAVDSGLAYLITTQSILGVAILWVFIVYGSREDTPEQIRFTHATCLYLALTLMVSFGFLSIKTAALFWFVHGALQGASHPEPDGRGAGLLVRDSGVTTQRSWRTAVASRSHNIRAMGPDS
jgi:putative polymerase